MLKNTVLALVLCSLVCETGGGSLTGGPIGVSALRKVSDLVVVAAIRSISKTSNAETVQLQIQKVLQGQAGALVIVASFSPPDGVAMPIDGMLTGNATGASGIWFLKEDSAGYKVLPLASGLYSEHDAFLPVSASDLRLIPPVGSEDSQLLWYAVRWYQSLKIPTPGDDARLFKSLDSADRSDALAAGTLLIQSDQMDQRAVGLATSIRLGSDDAVMIMCNQIDFLASSPKLHRLLDALGMYYQPRGTGAVPALLQVSARHVAIPGMDAAVGSVLQKIGTQSVLPAMVELLDSHDPKAQIRAASFFANFAMFADEHGNIPGGLVSGPFASPATAANTPRQDSAESPSQYAQFWKAWWSGHRAELGFPMK